MKNMSVPTRPARWLARTHRLVDVGIHNADVLCTTDTEVTVVVERPCDLVSALNVRPVLVLAETHHGRTIAEVA